MNSTRSFGAMTATPLFASSLPAPRTPSAVVRSFLDVAEGFAHRWIDTRKGILLLQMTPYTTDTGSIYIYDRDRDFWYRLSFEQIDDTFTVESFEQAYAEYRLAAYVGQPGLLLKLAEPESPVEKPASAPIRDVVAADGFLSMCEQYMCATEQIAA